MTQKDIDRIIKNGKFKIEFKTGNAAFQDENDPNIYWNEIARILESFSIQARKHHYIRNDCPVYDCNGNVVGKVSC